MKNLCSVTSISEETLFSISISEDFGWIEPVFLLISPNLKEVLRLEDGLPHLLVSQHFEIVKSDNDNYGLHFFNSENIINGNTSDLKIVKAKYVEKETINSITHSLFDAYYTFKEVSSHQEYCFFFIANNICYLTAITSFGVDDYV